MLSQTTTIAYHDSKQLEIVSTQQQPDGRLYACYSYLHTYYTRSVDESETSTDSGCRDGANWKLRLSDLQQMIYRSASKSLKGSNSSRLRLAWPRQLCYHIRAVDIAGQKPVGRGYTSSHGQRNLNAAPVMINANICTIGSKTTSSLLTLS